MRPPAEASRPTTESPIFIVPQMLLSNLPLAWEILEWHLRVPESPPQTSSPSLNDTDRHGGASA